MVATTDPGRAVRRGEQRVDLVLGEERDDAFGRSVWAGSRAPARSPRRARDGAGRRSETASRIAARRALRVLTLLPRSCSRWSRNAAISGGVEVVDLELGRLLAGRCVREGEQQPQRVAVGGDGVGLAWRWPISRSVKNASRVGARALIGVPPEVVLEPLGGQRQQLRGGRQIPVGGGRVDVPEVGGQQRAAAASTSPPSRYPSSKVPTAKVWRRSWIRAAASPVAVRARPAPGAAGTVARHCCAVEPRPGRGDEEAPASRASGRSSVAASQVTHVAPPTVLGWSGSWRDLPNFVSRIISTPAVEVDVTAVEADRLADPHAR